jgi:hypothetical protein
MLIRSPAWSEGPLTLTTAFAQRREDKGEPNDSNTNLGRLVAKTTPGKPAMEGGGIRGGNARSGPGDRVQFVLIRG